MKFLVSFFALVLYFIFALADTAEEITYAKTETTVATNPTVLVAGTDLTARPTITLHHQKAGLSL